MHKQFVILEQRTEIEATHENGAGLMGKTVEQACHILLMAEFRGLEKRQQAVLLYKHHECSQVAADACGLKRRAVQRALVAQGAGRVLGEVGRPTLLPPLYEEELVKVIDEAEAKQQHLTKEQFSQKVCVFFFSLTHFLLFLTHTFSPQARDIYMTIPNINLAGGIPAFSPSFLFRVIEAHSIKLKARQPIEQVCSPFTLSLLLPHF
jgi:hypothetical protein